MKILKLQGQVKISVKGNMLFSDKKFEVEVNGETLIISNSGSNSIVINNGTIVNSFSGCSNSTISISGCGDIVINGTKIDINDINSADNNSEDNGVLEYNLEDINTLQEFILSGQSSLNLDSLTNKLGSIEVSLSGQSSFSIDNAHLFSVNANLSGQSSFDMEESVIESNIDITTSGQSTANVRNSSCNVINAFTSGMSKIKIKKTKYNSIKEKISGMSEIIKG